MEANKNFIIRKIQKILNVVQFNERSCCIDFEEIWRIYDYPKDSVSIVMSIGHSSLDSGRYMAFSEPSTTKIFVKLGRKRKKKKLLNLNNYYLNLIWQSWSKQIAVI